MAAPKSNRTRRFALPDLADQRAEGVIEAYISSPERGHRREAEGARDSMGGTNPLLALENRIAWNEALKREDARHQRYRRPCAVVVVGVQPRARADDTDDWPGRLAGPIAHVLRRGARQTDLVTRATDGRFQVLLPETSATEAERFAARVLADCEVWVRAVGAPVDIRVASAAASGEMDLEAALARAVGSVEPRAGVAASEARAADSQPAAAERKAATQRPERTPTLPGVAPRARTRTT
jgi:GGDEF domain-containing protein